MNIVSLNAWGGRRGDALLGWIEEAHADLYLLQEVFSAPALADDTLPDGDGHHIRPNLYGDLRRILPGYTSLFVAGSRGYVNDSTWTGLPLEYGLAAFVGPSIPVVAVRSGLVHGTFRQSGEGAPPLSRSAQVVRCLAPEGPFTVGHMHGLWDPAGKHDTPARRRQAERFRDLLANAREPDDATVACGDFNVLPSSETFDVLGSLDLRDLVRANDICSTRTALYTKPTRFADYMLVGPRVRVSRFEVLQEPIVSDHCALVLSASRL